MKRFQSNPPTLTTPREHLAWSQTTLSVARSSSCMLSLLRSARTDFHRCSPSFPQCSPRSDGYLPLQHDSHIDPGPPHSPITFVSSTLSSSADTRVSVKAPCAGGEPIKHIGGYHCSICNESFARRDIAQRHIDYTGAKVRCRYCGKLGSDRHSNKARHLLDNKKCKKLWKVGYEAGRFTERSVEDAYRYD